MEIIHPGLSEPEIESNMSKIVVAGSSNIDMTAYVKTLPRPGETIGGGRFMQANGGKGANQAVAAGRLGGDAEEMDAALFLSPKLREPEAAEASGSPAATSAETPEV